VVIAVGAAPAAAVFGAPGIETDDDVDARASRFPAPALATTPQLSVVGAEPLGEPTLTDA
jgi:hypothetical protein